MGDLLVGALSVLLSTNAPMALSNRVAQAATSLPIPHAGPDTQDPRYAELRVVMEADDAAEDEIGRWLAEREALQPDDPLRETDAAFRRRVDERNARVRSAYETLIQRHPAYAPARNAFAAFLGETGDEEGAIQQLEKASALDPNDPSIWNNLANHYGHVGPIEKAFPAYEKAIALQPFEPTYRYNLGTVVFLFRKDAMAYYQCDEAAVFRRALDHYREVRRLRPHNFRYAFDFAQTWYGVKPEPADTPEKRTVAERSLAESALGAWHEALVLADNDGDRDGIFLHLARWHLRLGQWDAVRTNLALVARPEHLVLKARLQRNLEEKEPKPTR
jgi:tetratricopeptide (TPR) repeat protein